MKRIAQPAKWVTWKRRVRCRDQHIRDCLLQGNDMPPSGNMFLKASSFTRRAPEFQLIDTESLLHDCTG